MAQRAAEDVPFTRQRGIDQREARDRPEDALIVDLEPTATADPAECGDLIAYICSAQAGFMTGQNIVNDGGVYQGLF